MKLVLLYGLFALVAILANLFGQEAVLRLYEGPYSMIISMVVGTGVGLFVKYVLDKKYIFNYKTPTAFENSKAFLLYCLMGLFTTAIFWGFEIAFEILFQSKAMRFTGACIGLTLGYILKYRLDKRFVFRQISNC